MLLLPSLALNSRIRDPSTLRLLEALKYGARDNNIRINPLKMDNIAINTRGMRKEDLLKILLAKISI
jgi:hypothetical protein